MGNDRFGLGVSYPSYNTGRMGSQDGGRQDGGRIAKLVKDLQQWNKPLPSNPNPTNPVNTSQIAIGGTKGGVQPSGQTQISPNASDPNNSGRMTSVQQTPSSNNDDRLTNIFNQSSEIMRTLKDWDDQRSQTDYNRAKEQQQATWNREDQASNRNANLERSDRADAQARGRSDAVFAKNLSATNLFDPALADEQRGAQLEGFLAAVDRTTRQSENLANYWSNKAQTEAGERIAGKQMQSSERLASINNNNQKNWTKYGIDREFDASLIGTLGNVYGQIPRR